MKASRASYEAFKNKAKIQKASICGCFYCMKTFEPGAIDEWEDETAFCPHCGVDAVLADQADAQFLEEAHRFAFSARA